MMHKTWPSEGDAPVISKGIGRLIPIMIMIMIMKTNMTVAMMMVNIMIISLIILTIPTFKMITTLI